MWWQGSNQLSHFDTTYSMLHKGENLLGILPDEKMSSIWYLLPPLGWALFRYSNMQFFIECFPLVFAGVWSNEAELIWFSKLLPGRVPETIVLSRQFKCKFLQRIVNYQFYFTTVWDKTNAWKLMWATLRTSYSSG